MKKLCNASAIAAFLTAVCFTAVSCNKTPSESTLPVEKELGVSIELTSATETSVSVDITAEKDAEGYIYAIGEAGKLNEFQNGTMVLLEDELTSTSAVVEIRPGGDTSKYRYMLGSMELLDYFENGTWPDIMWENDVTAPKETQATGLTPGETYTIFAQPFAENGTRGETQIIEFTTPTADEAE